MRLESSHPLYLIDHLLFILACFIRMRIARTPGVDSLSLSSGQVGRREEHRRGAGLLGGFDRVTERLE